MPPFIIVGTKKYSTIVFEECCKRKWMKKKNSPLKKSWQVN